ncbi:TonB-dependent receptor [Porticoccaceae bacterium]|nr:TonB-dependent receptor [Porticoccaceae bacterium]MDB9949645.1 TonB-dependent receptor [Porticoccaceae bacterium]
MLFKKKILASSVALALAGTTLPAYAQDGVLIEEVIVQGGIRGSLARSMDIKRDSAGVVDAISAEDMGKFPDANLAESLQRITGVSISRQRGEGSQVTVRGFGPEYNLVTLNGRQMPTHSNTSRSFDFGDLASEGIAGVQVYKTGRADVPTGGVGSLINISTTRPLENPGQTASFSAKMVNDTSTREGDEITPEFSGIYSNTFANDTIGIAITASSQTRNNGVNAAETTGWFTNPGDYSGARGVPNDANQVNRSTSDAEFYSIPQQIAYAINEYESKRINGQLVLQWAPTETVTATLDYIHSELDLDHTMSDMSAWFSNSNASSQTSLWNDGEQRSPLMYSETHDNADFAMGVHQDGRKNENSSVGLNLEWQASDRLNIALDYHDSSAETGANSPYGTSSLVTMASFNKVGSTVYYDTELPILSQNLNSGADGADRPLYKNDMIITGSVFSNEAAKMDIEQSKLSGNFELSESSSIDFGIQLTEVSNRFVSSNVQLDNWGGFTQPGELTDILTRSSIAGQFDQVDGGNDPRLHTEYFTTSLEEIISVGEASYAATDTAYAQTGDCGTGYCASTDWSTDKRTTEETSSAYIQLNSALEYYGMPVNLQMGLRYEETDVTSAALAPTYDDVYWLGGNEFTMVAAVDENGDAIQAFEDYTGDYSLLLPSIDMDIEVAENVIVRASYSQTATRPSFTDIQGGITVGGTSFKNDGGFANGGNPGLIPIESDNYDVSVEWYYDEGSYLSVGYFEKNVANFIGSSVRQGETLFNLNFPLEGTLFNQAVADSGIDPLQYSDVGAYILANYPDNAAIDGDRIYGVDGDPLVTFQITSPANQEDASVDGIEINLQHNFGETGFGMIANATFVNADVAYDNMQIDSQFVLNGLSDSANLVAFYDKDGLQARLAYNWRDEFLAGVGQGAGTTSNPTNIEAYGQLDISASYDYSDNLTIFFAGLNVLEETYNVYGRDELQVLQAGQTGARYDIGVRYSFK